MVKLIFWLIVLASVITGGYIGYDMGLVHTIPMALTGLWLGFATGYAVYCLIPKKR